MSNSAQSSSQNPEQHIRDLFARLPQEHQAAYQRLSLDQKRLFLQRLVQRENVQPPQYLRVFRPEFDRAAHDPLDPRKRYHTGVFVEVDRNTGKGTLFHVIGSIIDSYGMTYQEKTNYNPRDTRELHAYALIGQVSQADFDSGRISAILRELPTPPQQQSENYWGKTKAERAELIWVSKDWEPHAPGEKIRPIFKCNEWTDQHAIPALQQAGVLRPA